MAKKEKNKKEEVVAVEATKKDKKEAKPAKAEAKTKKAKVKIEKPIKAYSFGKFIVNLLLLIIGALLIAFSVIVMMNPDTLQFVNSDWHTANILNDVPQLVLGVVILIGFWIAAKNLRDAWNGVLGIGKKERIAKAEAKRAKKNK